MPVGQRRHSIMRATHPSGNELVALQLVEGNFLHFVYRSAAGIILIAMQSPLHLAAAGNMTGNRAAALGSKLSRLSALLLGFTASLKGQRIYRSRDLDRPRRALWLRYKQTTVCLCSHALPQRLVQC